jgi:hypothetical protein
MVCGERRSVGTRKKIASQILHRFVFINQAGLRGRYRWPRVCAGRSRGEQVLYAEDCMYGWSGVGFFGYAAGATRTA